MVESEEIRHGSALLGVWTTLMGGSCHVHGDGDGVGAEVDWGDATTVVVGGELAVGGGGDIEGVGGGDIVGVGGGDIAGVGGGKSGPSYSTYAVQQMLPPSSLKRILAAPPEVSTLTTSGSGNGEKPSF